MHRRLREQPVEAVHRDGRPVHPQQPRPEATASVLAAPPQQEPSAAASAAVPQHGAAAASAGSGRPARGGLPQQPPDSAAAGTPVKPPWVWVSLTVVLLLGSGNCWKSVRFRLLSNSTVV